MEFIKVMLSGQEEETYYEEIANILTHFIAMILSAIGLYSILTISAFQDRWQNRWSSLIYGSALLLLYTFSTTYHSAGIQRIDSRYLTTLKKLDYISIYLLIAGTYTPMILVGIMKFQRRMKLGVFLLCCEWGCAFTGVVMQMMYEPHEIPLALSIGTYLFMGWFGIFGFSLPVPVLKWTFAGGVLYSIGVLFLIWDSLHFNHSVWHMFTMAASVSHFVAICLLLATKKGDTVPVTPGRLFDRLTKKTSRSD